MYQIDPTLPYGRYVNQVLADGQYMSFGATYNGMKVAFPGDPLTYDKVPNSTVDWNAATTQQKAVYDYYWDRAIRLNPSNPWSMFPPDYDTIIHNNVGPQGANEYWNWSYAGWGLVPGQPANTNLKTANGAVVIATGAVVDVYHN